MKKKKIYKSTFLVTVLHDEPNYDPSLEGMAFDMDQGGTMGSFEKQEEIALVGEEAVNATNEVGGDGGFFGMDEDGNDIYDDEYEESVDDEDEN